MESDGIFLITICGVMLGALLSIGLITIRRPGITVRLLGFYTLVLSIGLAEPLIDKIPEVMELLRSVWGGFSLLYGPLLFLYVRSRLGEVSKLARKDLIHLAPFFVYQILLVVVSLIQSGDRMDSDALDLLIYELLFLQIFTYCILCFKILASRKREVVSPVTKIRVAFVTTLVILSTLLFVSSFTFSHVRLIFDLPLNSIFAFSIQLGLSFLIFVIALLNTENMHLTKFTTI
jgi:hypothetical protein